MDFQFRREDLDAIDRAYREDLDRNDAEYAGLLANQPAADVDDPPTERPIVAEPEPQRESAV